MTVTKKCSIEKTSVPSAETGDAAWAWSTFWQSNNLSACTPDNDTNNDLLLLEWRAFFMLLDDGASILDLGTGNGALAVEAVTAGRTASRTFDVHGCDLARIEPLEYVQSRVDDLAKITFHKLTPMEKLPFDDGSFDAVCGQYALEYSDVTRSVPELLRVLRSGGRLQFLLHNADGALYRRNAMQRQQAQVLLDSSLFSETRNMLIAVVAAGSATMTGALEEGMRAIAVLKKTMDRLMNSFSGDDDQVLPQNVYAAVSRLAPLRQSHDLHQLLALVDDIERRLRAQNARFQAMLHAGLDKDSLQRLSATFGSVNAMDIRTRPALTGSGKTCVGYWLTAIRS